jgi:hypothetical protein
MSSEQALILGRLVAVIETLSDRVASLESAVDAMRDEIAELNVPSLDQWQERQLEEIHRAIASRN